MTSFHVDIINTGNNFDKSQAIIIYNSVIPSFYFLFLNTLYTAMYELEYLPLNQEGQDLYMYFTTCRFAWQTFFFIFRVYFGTYNVNNTKVIMFTLNKSLLTIGVNFHSPEKVTISYMSGR